MLIRNIYSKSQGRVQVRRQRPNSTRRTVYEIEGGVASRTEWYVQGSVSHKVMDRLERVAETRPERSFTEDVIVVEVWDQSLTDLELIDLPGFIQSVEDDKDKNMIGLLRDLAKSYMMSPNTLIVMCCPMNDDMENQEVRMMAREHDPDGLRTFGVLTKADLTVKATEDEWISIIQNKKFPLQHGYFVVRNPTQDELNNGMSPQEAREAETRYFTKDPLGLKLAKASGRAGINPLRSTLGRKLTELLRREIPGLRRQLEVNVAECRGKLSGMTEEIPPEAARSQLMQRVDQTVRILKESVECLDPDRSLWPGLKRAYRNLGFGIFSARPRFSFGDQMLMDKCMLDADRCVITLDNTQDLTNLKAASKNLPGSSIFELKTAFRTALAGSTYQVEDHPAMPCEITFEYTGDLATEWYTVDRVKDLVGQCSGRELPLPGGPAAYRAASRIVKTAQNRWKQSAQQCLEEVTIEVIKSVESVAAEVGGSFPKLVGQIIFALKVMWQKCKDQAENDILRLLEEIEGAPDLFTQNRKGLLEDFERSRQHIKKHLGLTMDLDKSTNLSQLRSWAAQVTTKALERFSVPDDRDDAIWCMAAAHAYHKVAMARFTDTVPRTIDSVVRSFIRGVGTTLQEALAIFTGEQEDHMYYFTLDDGPLRERRECEQALRRATQGLQLLDDARPGRRKRKFAEVDDGNGAGESGEGVFV